MQAQAEALGSAAFEATHAPFLLVDRQLRIRRVNKAYEEATGQPRSVLLDEELFEAFPDNPANPNADGVARLAASLELVLRRGQRHHMALQRYDVPDRNKPDTFRYKVWAPVNSPIHDSNGKTVAVLHHVEDVTELFPTPAELPTAAEADDSEPPASWATLLRALRHQRAASAHLTHQVDTLREALETNRQISVAVGRVMTECGLDREAAFRWLVAKSQKAHRKLADIAHDLVVDLEARAETMNSKAAAIPPFNQGPQSTYQERRRPAAWTRDPGGYRRRSSSRQGELGSSQ